MSLTDKIAHEIKEAMKQKKQERLLALRAIKSELLLMQTSGSSATEADEVKMLQKLVKQRKESAELYETQNRMDLAEPEIYQADVIREFLPRQLSDPELTAEIREIIEETHAKGLADLGKVMGIASKRLAGKAEGKAISEKVKELLA